MGRNGSGKIVCYTEILATIRVADICWANLSAYNEHALLLKALQSKQMIIVLLVEQKLSKLTLSAAR